MTTKSTIGGAAYRTIAILSTAELTHAWFLNDKIFSTASDIYAIDTSNSSRGFEGGGIRGCTFSFASQSTSSRILQLSECSGAVYVDDNIFDIQDTGITNRMLVSIDEESGAATTVYFRGNKALSTNATSFVSRGVTINNSDTCVVSDNDIGNVSIICSGDVFVSDNNIVNGVALVVPLTVEGAARVKAHDNTIRHSLTTNAICAEFIDCARANLHDNTLVATSTSVMARATTSGILNVRGNNYVNGSTGAPVGVTGTGMIGGDLGAYFTESGSGTAWTDANRLSAAIMKIGTVFWNSSDNAPNYSDGTDWRSAAGVVT